VGFLGIFWEFSLLWLSPVRYPVGMSKIIRYTVTLTVTEIWTIVWAADDDPLRHLLTVVVQNTPNTKDKQDELFQATVSKAESGKPSASARKKRPPNDRKTNDVKFQPVQFNQVTNVCATNEFSSSSL